MLQVNVVLVANEFHQFRIRQQACLLVDRPRLCIGLGIIDGDLNIHVTKILAPKTLDDMQGIRGWLPGLIQPGLAVKTPGIDHQSIAFPLTCRITHPTWSEVLSQLAAIQEDLPPEIESLVDNHHESWSLDDLPRWGDPVDPRDTLRKASRIRVLSLVQSSGAFNGECLGPGLIRDIRRFEVFRKVLVVPARGCPDSRHVWAAIGQSRSRRGEIRFSVGPLWNCAGAYLRPLSMNRRANQRQERNRSDPKQVFQA